ncbi:hypothetical protein [Rhizobium phaseoli]|uniref:DUF3592 domain-containing protein n=1 Tax=Rhizobium phaseoli TaxID=396 RepID=A0ABM6C8W2_9HYPH|nr:hypothetical protein [Rhizobium phaseoli]ANL84637.1 hypothetical protein AMC81_CH01856 [Rhizobium phaseoli]ANL91144.1 hypothetical protein AMC80_CH01856 [Rhizobium phaseoli]
MTALLALLIYSAAVFAVCLLINRSAVLADANGNPVTAEIIPFPRKGEIFTHEFREGASGSKLSARVSYQQSFGTTK